MITPRRQGVSSVNYAAIKERRETSPNLAFKRLLVIFESAVSKAFCGKKTDCRELKDNGEKEMETMATDMPGKEGGRIRHWL